MFCDHRSCYCAYLPAEVVEPGFKRGYHPAPPADEVLQQAWIDHFSIQNEQRLGSRYHYRNHQRQICLGRARLLQLALEAYWFATDDVGRQAVRAGQAFICVLPSPTSYGLVDGGTCCWSGSAARSAGRKLSRADYSAPWACS